MACRSEGKDASSVTVITIQVHSSSSSFQCQLASGSHLCLAATPDPPMKTCSLCVILATVLPGCRIINLVHIVILLVILNPAFTVNICYVYFLCD